MPRRKKKTLDAGKEARRLAREVIGLPSQQRAHVDKRFKPPKHKKKDLPELGEM